MSCCLYNCIFNIDLICTVFIGEVSSAWILAVIAYPIFFVAVVFAGCVFCFDLCEYVYMILYWNIMSFDVIRIIFTNTVFFSVDCFGCFTQNCPLAPFVTESFEFFCNLFAALCAVICFCSFFCAGGIVDMNVIAFNVYSSYLKIK